MPERKTASKSRNTAKKKKMRPGRNPHTKKPQGLLKTDAGPGRPKDTPEVKEIKAAIRTGREMNAITIRILIETGKYKKILLKTIEQQARAGRLDALKWLVESTEPIPSERRHIVRREKQSLVDLLSEIEQDEMTA